MLGQNEIGHIFTATVEEDGNPVDISTASVKQFVFRKANTGALLTVAADFVTDGTNGQLKYITIANDLSEHGTWQMQVALTLPTWTGRSGIVEFAVDPLL